MSKLTDEFIVTKLFKKDAEFIKKRMNPNVGLKKVSDTEKWAFEKVWEYLIKVSIINRITFKKILVLVYRNCFFIDHKEIKKNKIRYEPSGQILNFIENVEKYVLKDGFMDKFKTQEIGLLEFLHFIDLLGWNEDVKYHVTDGKPDFIKRNKNVGRVNTLLSIISAPLMISNFIDDIIQKTRRREPINVKLITSTIQTFSKSRGICVLPNRELLKELKPYLTE